jgi:hypothetical protein
LSTSSNSVALNSILILTLYSHLCLSSGYFPSDFPIKILYVRLMSPMRSTCPAHFIPCNFITLITMQSIRCS